MARCVRWVHRHVQADSSSLSRRKTSRGGVGGCRPRGSRDDNEARFQPAFLSLPLFFSLSLSASLAKHTGHREASPSKYAHVSNVHFNHRSHRPSRAIAPSPLSFFFSFFLFSPLISLFLRREPFIRRAIPFRATYLPPSLPHATT